MSAYTSGGGLSSVTGPVEARVGIGVAAAVALGCVALLGGVEIA